MTAKRGLDDRSASAPATLWFRALARDDSAMLPLAHNRIALLFFGLSRKRTTAKGESKGRSLSDHDEKVLEHFVYDNPDLERLEAVLDDFNPFQAMRWTRQEARHSAFLRWLLDPQETHGLGSYFLRAFTKRIAHRSAGLHPKAPSIFDVDSWSLNHTEVLQEWNNIDLLIKNDFDSFILVVENKVDSTEHSGQLQRYRSLVERQFASHKKLYAYLTIGGTKASDDYYVSVDYSEIVALVAETLNRRGEQLSTEVRTFLSQYVEMVRRNIVEDSEIQRICQRIYEKHRRALDVLFEYRPDKASEVTTMLRELISEHENLEEDHCTKSAVRFIPTELDFLPRAGDGWTPSKRMLLFEIENYRSKLWCRLTLGPGPQEMRGQIHDVVRQHPVCSTTLPPSFIHSTGHSTGNRGLGSSATRNLPCPI